MNASQTSEQVIRRLVGAVRVRLVVLRGIGALAVGVLVAAVGYAGWAVSGVGPPRWGWLAVAGMVGAVLRARRVAAELRGAAHRIDEALDLKDRVASAEEFSQAASRPEIYALQIKDAAERVGSVAVSRVAPWGWRRDCGMLALAGGLLVLGQWPSGGGEAQAVAPLPAPPAVMQEAEAVAAALDELAEELAGLGEEDLQRTVEALREEAGGMSEPGSDLESGLQALGRIRNELEQAVASMDLAADEALLAAMAEALQMSALTRPGGRALAEGAYAEAAEKLEQAAEQAADPANKFPEQAQAMVNPLEQLSRQAAEAGNRALSEALQESADSIRAGDCQASSDALRKQADVTRRTAARAKIAGAVGDQVRQLAEARDRMTGQYCEACRQGGAPCEGGVCASQGMSLAAQEDPTSADPSDSAGMGTHDAPFGEPADLDAVRVQEQVTGAMGAGPSEFTLELAPQSGQHATREYREVYAAYRKLSDQALEQEPLPAPYQSIIRTYFESIRPHDDK